MIPQFVGVIEFPRRSGFIINFIDDCNWGCIWLILGCVFSNYCLKHSSEDQGVPDGVRDIVQIVQKTSGEIRKAAIGGGGNEVIDSDPRRCGPKYSRILFHELGQGNVV